MRPHTFIRTLVFALFLVSAVPFAHAGWYNGGGGSWQYRQKIVIDHTKVGAALSNFPLLFNSTDASLATTANSGKVTNSSGFDIIFTSDDGVTKLPHEIESYTASSGALVAWVKVPNLSSTYDTVIYVYFGNTAISTSQANATGVWDSNFVGVWHLGDAGPTNVADSTSNANTGSGVNSPTFGATGQMDSAMSFVTASSQEVKVPEAAAFDFGTNAFTAEIWIKTGSSTASAIMAKLTGTPPSTKTDDYWAFVLNANGTLTFRLFDNGTTLSYNATSGSAYNNNAWHHLVGVRTDATHTSVYVDGVGVGTAAPANVSLTTAGNIGIGAFDYSGTPEVPITASLDEVRVSNTARASTWISTEYNNGHSPSTFYTIGPVESNSGMMFLFE